MITAGSTQTPLEPEGGDRFLEVLDETLEALREAGIPFLIIGAIGSAVYGRDRGTRDIDLFVRPELAGQVLQLLASKGYRTRVENEHWLYKAFVDGVCVDVIFRASRDILLGEEMLARARAMPFRGREVPVAAPEDLVIMKAQATEEETPRYWYDALAILAATDLDWDYLVARARQHGAKRILSLLLFAASIDIIVPQEPLERLLETADVGRAA